MIALMIVSSAILSQAGPDGQAKASPVVIAIDRNSPAVA